MPPPLELAEGLWQLVLPLPIPRLPSVNAYVFPGPDGTVVIDPGGGHDDGYEALADGMKDLGLSLGDIRSVVCTHLHPDHMGLATRLVTEVGCDYVMHSSAATRMESYNDWGPIRRWIAELAARHGAPEDRAALLGEDDARPDWAPLSMPPTVLVDDGDEIPTGPGRSIRAVHTPGHDESHICLVDSATGFLFSGDHVLPRITPFVPFSDADGDNLGTYLESLERVEKLDPPVTYPAHLGRIERGAARANQIRLHHQRRLDGMLDTLAAGPSTAWAIMESSFKPDLPPMHTRLALQETLAHLEYLRARRRVEHIDDGGVLAYRRLR